MTLLGVVALAGWFLAAVFAGLFLHSEHLLRRAWKREDWYASKLTGTLAADSGIK